MNLQLVVTCPRGIEPLQAEELRQLGLTVTSERPSSVEAQGDLAAAYRVCLWSRLANRVLVQLADQPARTAEDLTRASAAVPWEEHLAPQGQFRVVFHGKSNDIRNTQFGAQCIKDGVIDRFRAAGLARPAVEKRDPDLHIHARLAKGRILISLDLAGDSLHRRGYRTEAGEAPLKENLAAALVWRSGWPAIADNGGDLVDPLCGSGTLLIEAALMATDTAPGLLRDHHFAFIRWPQHDAALWNRLVKDAEERRAAGRQASQSRYRGFDQDRQVIAAAWGNIERAGLADRVHVERQTLAEFALPENLTPGLMVTNPPYGERLSERRELDALYTQLGDRLREHAQGWRFGLFTALPELGRRIGLRSHKQYKLFNGAIPAQLLLFDVNAENERTPDRLDGLPHARIANQERAAMFANRLRKNRKTLGSWARKQGIQCYRLYDADMPEYALAVDVYDDWLHVQEYAPPASIDTRSARERLGEAMAVIPEVLEVPAKRMVVKQRRRQKGLEQYEKRADQQQGLTVMEGGCLFRVNLTDYLDTGLFLDHRPVRLWLGQNAADKRVLNLFCYTGAATVHAAKGGARSSLSLDLSNTYLDWARSNWALNELSDQQHRLQRADCLAWLAEKPQAQFDLIFLDPPTFSNSARMDEVLDTQRDHVRLIDQAMARLAAGGTLVFSTNFRRFKLDPSLSERYHVENRTQWSIDRDFARNSKIHQCWFIRHP